jgi:hypothetical protein
MILVLVVHFVRIVLPELVAGEPIRPWAVDPTYLFEPETPATQSGEAGPAESAEPPEQPAGDDSADATGDGESAERPSQGDN